MDARVAATSGERGAAVRKAIVWIAIAASIFIAVALLMAAAFGGSETQTDPTAHQQSSFYLTLAYVHFATIAPCFLIGVWLLLRPKGTAVHKLLGKVYMVLISFSSVVAAAMPAAFGPRLWNHFGFIHLFCVLVFVSVPYALWAIRRGNVRGHANAMRGLFLGGVIIAGAFAFGPGRVLHGWLFG